VTRPTFLPLSRAIEAMGTNFVPSGNMFTQALNMREPLPHADDADDESVTRESRDAMFIRACRASGRECSACQMVPVPRARSENCSASGSTPALIPSATIQMMFLGRSFRRCAACNRSSPAATGARAPAPVRNERRPTRMFMLLVRVYSD
jgi:hypothetical protein